VGTAHGNSHAQEKGMVGSHQVSGQNTSLSERLGGISGKYNSLSWSGTPAFSIPALIRPFTSSITSYAASLLSFGPLK
jgi:hypothetical protein